MMNRIYIPYWNWEDWLNGMWRTLPGNEELLMINKATEFTGDWVKYGNAMKEVIKAWPNTMLNSLTNPSINKRAFLGHCACSFSFNCPEYITRIAWHRLTDKQRQDADMVAQQTIDTWVKEYSII